MGAAPSMPPVTEADVCAAAVEAAVASEAAAVAEEAAVSVAADLADLEAQPERTRPAAMRENTTEILIFVVRLFMVLSKWLVSRHKKWFLSKR